MYKNFFLIIIFFSLTINSLKADEKVFFIDIDQVLSNTVAGKELLNKLKKEEEIMINKFKSNDDNFKNEEKKILAKKNLITENELTNEIKILQEKFQKYRTEKIKEIDDLKVKRNRNIVNFLSLINPIIEKYMSDNSIYMLLDKKHVFISNKDYDITKNLIELIDNQIRNVQIK